MYVNFNYLCERIWLVIATWNKCLALVSLYKRPEKKSLPEEAQSVIAEGASFRPPLYVLIINPFFVPFPRPTECKVTTILIHRNKCIEKIWKKLLQKWKRCVYLQSQIVVRGREIFALTAKFKLDLSDPIRGHSQKGYVLSFSNSPA